MAEKRTPTSPPAAAPPPAQHQPPSAMNAGAAYNLVSDTVVGVNVRVRDNLFQLGFIVVSVFIGLIVGYFVAGPQERPLGLVFGAIGGLIGGTFVSGIILMIYRAVRHAQGKHS